MGRVRLIDVAERAGVSMKTVSNVVRGNPVVTAQMRERVQAAIAELGYRPNLTARQLVTGRTGMLALAIPELDHPYFCELARHIAQIAPELGYRVLIEQTLVRRDAERAVISDRENGLVDGVLFHPVITTSEELAQLKPSFPLVLLGESDPPAAADHVMIDNEMAARAAVEYLLRSGRRRIAFLGEVADTLANATAPRMRGWRSALAEAGITVSEQHVLRCEEYSTEAAAAALSSALDAGMRIDAVLCREDRFAVGALHAARAAGRRVPEDLAIVGWDDTHIARWSVPPLTAIAPDKEALARMALTLVHERIEGFTGPGRHRLVPHSIAVRASS